MFAYFLMLPRTLLTAWSADGSETGNHKALSKTLNLCFILPGNCIFNIFRCFLCPISKGYIIREYVLAAMVIPASVRFIWSAIVGTTPCDIALYSTTGDSIITAGTLAQLFMMLDFILSNSQA